MGELPKSKHRKPWEEVTTMANVLNLQADAVELTQETKWSHRSWGWWCDGGGSYRSFYYCEWW